MAADIEILFQRLQQANSAEKRPDRAIRDYVRSITKTPFSGPLTVARLSKTIAYAKRPELRNGHTAKVSVPKTDITLEIQLFENHQAEAQTQTKVTVSVLKYDGYSKTLFAQQEPWQEIEKAIAEPELNTDTNASIAHCLPPKIPSRNFRRRRWLTYHHMTPMSCLILARKRNCCPRCS